MAFSREAINSMLDESDLTKLSLRTTRTVRKGLMPSHRGLTFGRSSGLAPSHSAMESQGFAPNLGAAIGLYLVPNSV